MGTAVVHDLWQHRGAHHWQSFPEELNNKVDLAFRQGTTRLQYDIGSTKYTIDFAQEKQWRDEDCTRCRKVRRINASDPKKRLAGSGCWQHKDVLASDGWGGFPEDLNAKVELAYHGQAAWIRYQIFEKEYVLVFEDMKQCCTSDGHIREVRRLTDLPHGEAVGDCQIPMLWSEMSAGTYVEVELLHKPEFTNECAAVSNFFKKTTAQSVVSVKRIQNLPLWHSYVEFREQLKLKPVNSGQANEEFFWHGSRTNANEQIKRGGFNTAFGNGLIWLSTTSVYSTGYCPSKQMFLVRVSLGHIGVDSTHCGGMSSGHSRKDDQVGGGSDNRYTFANNNQLYPAYVVTFA